MIIVFYPRAALPIFVLALRGLLFKDFTVVPAAHTAPLATDTIVRVDLAAIDGKSFSRGQILPKNPRLPVHN
jgi:hypothetical protein